MKRVNFRRLIALLALFLMQSFVPADAAVKKNIAYGALPDEILDMYVPDAKQHGGKPSSVMIFVHGGGWKSGDKWRVKFKPAAFNAENYIFISINYPLLPRNPVEVQAQSVANSVVWVEKNIKRYGGNPQQIYLMGHSAGGHLAALIATDPAYLRVAGAGKDVLKGVVFLDSAAFNVSARMENLEGAIGAKAYQEAFGSDPERWKALSPVHQALQGRAIPPMLFLTASRPRQKELLANGMLERLRQLGVDYRNEMIEYSNPDNVKRNHLMINYQVGRKGDQVFPLMIHFIDGLSAGKP
ncbi:alpha/beta hydrolase [Thiomicrorhabdus sp.]|uniref:alpha/beta hydrolase n=1 Tax=Thiomicrorhabdus sp. TaxID=2039724 RepID=UPI0029C85ED3|nr:alpha/beta hydrolase [Thiomicrorhabdus sp.]